MMAMSGNSAPRGVDEEVSNLATPQAEDKQVPSKPDERQTAAPQSGKDLSDADKSAGQTGSDEQKTEVPAEPEQTKKPSRAVPPKGLSVDELRKFVRENVDVLKQHETYDNAEVLDNLKGISKSYFNYKDERRLIGSHLCECKFPALVIKMMRWFNTTGVFKNDDVWFPTYYSYNVCWNFTDASRDLAMELGSTGLIQLCGQNSKHAPYIENSESKNVNYLLKASLSILQNLSKVPELRDLYDEEGIKDALKPYLSHENEFFRATATMILTAIISEEENSRLEDTGCMEFIVHGLKSALKSTKNRRYRGFSPEELTECLSRMAVNDSNKKLMVERDALPSLVKMMQDDIVEEQIAACQTLWNLAFDKEVAAKIKAEPGFNEAIDKLSQSENARVKKMAKGTLWVLNEAERKVERKSSAETGSGGHIFISYSWAQQDEAVRIKDALKITGHEVWLDIDVTDGESLETTARAIQTSRLILVCVSANYKRSPHCRTGNQYPTVAMAAGYNVWIDVEMMGGSTLEAMADGVDKASVVLVCASEGYKMSPNARAEAEYTFQLKKPIVPVMMQRRYKPDGWLGMIMGAKLYINFDGKYPFEKAFSMLEKELAGRGKGGAVDMVDASPAANTQAPVPSKAVAPLVSKPPAPAPPATTTWDREKVQDWLSQHGLQSKLDTFSRYDGKMISCLSQVRHEAPDFFYKHLQDKLNLDMADICCLVAALDELPT